MPTAGVVGDGDQHERHSLPAGFSEAAFEGGEVDVPLEGMVEIGVAPLGDHEVAGLGAGVLDVGSRRVEVGVVGDHVPRLDDGAAQQALARSPLVGGDHVCVAEDPAHSGLELEEAPRAGVRLVALHDARPLVGAHRAGSGVCKEVN